MATKSWMRIVAAMSGLSFGASAFAATACTEERRGLKERAKVSCAEAEKTALAKIPDGNVKSAELEEENGRLLYSFDLKLAKKTGIDEVQVDAITGELIGVEHETPKAEAVEKHQSATERAKATKTRP